MEAAIREPSHWDEMNESSVTALQPRPVSAFDRHPHQLTGWPEEASSGDAMGRDISDHLGWPLRNRLISTESI